MNHLDELAESTDASASRNGFTLIEVLIAIVVVGILSAVVIIGISSLTNKGSGSACQASADAAKAAATVHYANTGAYPASLNAMTVTSPKELELPTGVTAPVNSTTGATWTLTMTPGSPPTFACTVP
ncbi:unannotated protein [freshwater metagenome]|uniref:Unannotated protein n=1 Tax=freshwater metagenome TaxID=449393 RepID=A0A6J7EWA5_9ZZZZ|nr:prepilin-type N-terminal cleavage/methylation domain-containing protein [Actinomycetota bacterium]